MSRAPLTSLIRHLPDDGYSNLLPSVADLRVPCSEFRLLYDNYLYSFLPEHPYVFLFGSGVRDQHVDTIK